MGAGLRLSAELLGPEYSLSWNSLDTGLKLFFSRRVQGEEGEDIVEKQNAESGVMPVVSDEAATYGYVAEDRHFCRAFLGKDSRRWCSIVCSIQLRACCFRFVSKNPFSCVCVR